jgi:hypothetical protein
MVTTLNSIVHQCCEAPSGDQTQVAKVLKMVDGIVSAEVRSCWINPNWQAPLVHQILEPGKGP